jgi:hypothetical protein
VEEPHDVKENMDHSRGISTLFYKTLSTDLTLASSRWRAWLVYKLHFRGNDMIQNIELLYAPSCHNAEVRSKVPHFRDPAVFELV